VFALADVEFLALGGLVEQPGLQVLEEHQHADHEDDLVYIAEEVAAHHGLEPGPLTRGVVVIDHVAQYDPEELDATHLDRGLLGLFNNSRVLGLDGVAGADDGERTLGDKYGQQVG